MEVLFCIFDLGQKFDFKKLASLLVGSCFMDVTFLCQMSTLPRNLNYHWKGREQKEDF